jgi:hypothetical protein
MEPMLTLADELALYLLGDRDDHLRIWLSLLWLPGNCPALFLPCGKTGLPVSLSIVCLCCVFR